MLRLYYSLLVFCQIAAVGAAVGFVLTNTEVKISPEADWTPIAPGPSWLYLAGFAVTMATGLIFLGLCSKEYHKRQMAEREDEARRINDQIELSN